MLFSDHFHIRRQAMDDWFDVILNADTLLFVDPFLVFKETQEPWANTYGKIIQHFDIAFKLIAEGNCNPDSIQYKKAIDMLVFPEPKEFCLGYTNSGTSGSGSGRGFAKVMAKAIADAIKRGLKHPKHFEELGVLNEGIGSDRISDITCTILKSEFIAYSQHIASKHGLPLAQHPIYAASFDNHRKRWNNNSVEVPTNPFNNKPLLLVPQRFLRELPTLNADDWWDHWENEQLRTDVNYEIMKGVDKATIVKLARENPESVRKWAEEKEAESPRPYDFKADKNGVWQWDPIAKKFTTDNPLSLGEPNSETSFMQFIETIINQFALFIEEQGGWRLLWNEDKTDKPEYAVQLLFRGIAQHYCKANDISLDAEVNLGRGPVDFKFSRGFKQRVHMEVKKLHNGKFWNGLETQLPSYMRSDQVKHGWFMSIRYRDGEQWDKREQFLVKQVKKVAISKNITLKYITIDARPKKSASNI